MISSSSNPASGFNERTWLGLLVRLRFLIITFLLGIELAISRLTPSNVPVRQFVLLIVLWYTLALFFLILYTVWKDIRLQSRVQVLCDLAMATADMAKATRIALSGNNRAIDVGRVLIDNRDDEQVFLVMAGVGFDAAIMAGAPSELKARLGPFAYFVSGTAVITASSLSTVTTSIAVLIDPHAPN